MPVIDVWVCCVRVGVWLVRLTPTAHVHVRSHKEVSKEDLLEFVDDADGGAAGGGGAAPGAKAATDRGGQRGGDETISVGTAVKAR